MTRDFPDDTRARQTMDPRRFICERQTMAGRHIDPERTTNAVDKSIACARSKIHIPPPKVYNTLIIILRLFSSRIRFLTRPRRLTYIYITIYIVVYTSYAFGGADSYKYAFFVPVPTQHVVPKRFRF